MEGREFALRNDLGAFQKPFLFLPVAADQSVLQIIQFISACVKQSANHCVIIINLQMADGNVYM